MKIALMGYSGSGKSTLAGKLGRAFQIPVLHLDSVNFLPGWNLRDRESANGMVLEFLKKESWIIDGNYGEFYKKRRIEEADLIILLLLPRFTCLKRAFFRYLKYRGKTREDMASGCNEKLDFEFIKWILYNGRNKAKREAFKQTIKSYPEKTIVLKSQKEIDEFLRGLFEY